MWTWGRTWGFLLGLVLGLLACRVHWSLGTLRRCGICVVILTRVKIRPLQGDNEEIRPSHYKVRIVIVRKVIITVGNNKNGYVMSHSSICAYLSRVLNILMNIPYSLSDLDQDVIYIASMIPEKQLLVYTYSSYLRKDFKTLRISNIQVIKREMHIIQIYY